MALLTRNGLAADTNAEAEGGALPPEALEAGDLPEGPLTVEWPSDRDPAELAPWLDRIDLLRVRFPATTDGRGFSIARRLRMMGYGGRLRAVGPLIADQSAAAWAVGFDEIEIPDATLARQPESVWSHGDRRGYHDKLGLR